MSEMKEHYRYGQNIKSIRARMKLISLLNPIYPLLPIIPIRAIAKEEPFKTIANEFGPSRLPIGSLPIGTPGVFIGGPFLSPLMSATILGWLEYGMYGLAVDYSNLRYISSGTSCGSGGCNEFELPSGGTPHPAVSLCGYCIDASDIGNMMFGLGGAARGYDYYRTYASAALYNGLADWLPDMQGVNLWDALSSPDGKGAKPGWQIGHSQAFNNQSQFCNIINGMRDIGYNDGLTLDQASQCSACTMEYVTHIEGKTSGIQTRNPRSLIRLSDGGSTIIELEDRTKISSLP